MPRITDSDQVRSRVTVACDQCRKRKIRCDGVKPRCTLCKNRDSPCSYAASPRQTSLEKRFESIESRFIKMEYSLESMSDSLSKLFSEISSHNTAQTQHEPTNLTAHNEHLSTEFNSRIGLLKRHINGSGDIGGIYTSGVITSVLSDTDITNLTWQLNYPELSSSLFSESNKMWKRQLELTARIIGSVDKLDPGYVDECKQFYCEMCNVHWTHMLLTPSEVRSHEFEMSLEHWLREGIDAAIVIIGSAMSASGGM